MIPEWESSSNMSTEEGKIDPRSQLVLGWFESTSPISLSAVESGGRQVLLGLRVPLIGGRGISIKPLILDVRQTSLLTFLRTT